MPQSTTKPMFNLFFLVLGLMFCNAQSTTFWVLKDLRVRMAQHPRGIHQWQQRIGKEKCGWRVMALILFAVRSTNDVPAANAAMTNAKKNIMELNTTNLAQTVIVLAHGSSKVEQPKSFRAPQPYSCTAA